MDETPKDTDKYDTFKQEVNALTLREKLKAESELEQKVLAWLEKNASDSLTEKIAGGEKTIAGSLRYAYDKAKERANGESQICVDDETVFGWIVHFFEEDSIEEPKAKPPAVRAAKGAKPQLEKKASTGPAKMSVQGEYKPSTPPPKKKDQPQLSLFDSLDEVK